MKLKDALRNVCLMKVIATNLVGKDHHLWHRGLIGIAFMLTGVLIAKAVGHSEYHVVAVLGDTVGYGLHGVGLVPFIEAIIAEV